MALFSVTYVLGAREIVCTREAKTVQALAKVVRGELSGYFIEVTDSRERPVIISVNSVACIEFEAL